MEVMLLCREDVRTANVIACDPDGVDCLVLEREYVERRLLFNSLTVA